MKSLNMSKLLDVARLTLSLLVYPLIVSWDTSYWVPVQCQKDQQPDPYAGTCLSLARHTNQMKFTEKEHFDKWMEGFKKTDPRFTVGNIEVYEYDSKRTVPKSDTPKK